MTTTINPYGKGVLAALSALWSAPKMALLTNAYSPDLANNATYADVQPFEIAATGYTAGGILIPSPSISEVAASSFGSAWSASANVIQGQPVQPPASNGFAYVYISAGVSGSSLPTFPTVVGQSVTDGTTVLVNVGRTVTVRSSANPTFSISGSAAYAVSYAPNVSNALIDCITLAGGALVSDVAGQLIIYPDAVAGYGIATTS